MEATKFPVALAEKDFIIPGMGAESLLCNEARRNLTDQQETAQWVGGIQVPKEVLSALFSALLVIAIAMFLLHGSNTVVTSGVVASLGGLKASHGAVVVHPTAYDGCVELAAMQLSHVACGSSLMDSNYKCAREMVKQHLLQAFVSVSSLAGF